MPTQTPDVSCVIPTYKRPTELAEAIDSVLRQGRVSAEVIVVDDCGDRSARWVESAYSSDPVRYIPNPVPSKGRPSLVRNIGWPMAAGRYIHFMDDDDIVPEGHYGRVVDAFSNAPGVAVVFGRVQPFGIDGSALERESKYFDTAKRRSLQLRKLGTRVGFSAWLNFNAAFLVGGSAVVRRECVEAIGGFNPSIQLVEDVDFVARSIRWGGAEMLDEVALHYRIHSSLMHDSSDKTERLHRAYRVMHADYRQKHGLAEFAAMKVLARTLEALPC